MPADWRSIPRIGLAFLLIAGNTSLHVLPLFTLAIVKALVPVPGFRRWCSRGLAAIAESWIGVNSACIVRFTRTRFEIEAVSGLRTGGSYLMLCNHQSWVDIPVLQKAFNRRIPFMRFFLKRQLFWVPVLGLAWWALDFPFMQRHSRATLARHPELRRQDMETTRRACQRFRGIPVSVMSFVEGTRFRPAKHVVQASPYRHLLRPRVGGVAFVLNAMGDVLQEVLDVTIVYPDGIPSMLDLMCNRIGVIKVYIRRHRIPAQLLDGDYEQDREYRVRIQEWINELWKDKDELITEALAKGPA
ncbi:MAG TPA: acyltransferase [Gammaproteobacteria bacterium]|nr:acyltransferase [Gammaproteobacteria bacterium]